jgi:hypothetical protein
MPSLVPSHQSSSLPRTQTSAVPSSDASNSPTILMTTAGEDGEVIRPRQRDPIFAAMVVMAVTFGAAAVYQVTRSRSENGDCDDADV